MLAEEKIIMWAKDNLQSPEFSCLALMPEERRDPNKPVQYVVTASPKLMQKHCGLPGSAEEPVTGRANWNDLKMFLE